MLKQLNPIWVNLLGNWKESLKFQLIITIPLVILAVIIYQLGYYPNDSKILQDRGWGAGFFRNHLGLVPYILFYFFFFIPLEEYFFRKLPLDLTARSPHLQVSLVFGSAMFNGLTRIAYPYPFGIILTVVTLALIYGYDYTENKSFIMLWLFHGIISVLAFSLNLW